MDRSSDSMQPDFGTYHYSTAKGSKDLREKVKLLFEKAFAELPFHRRDSKLKILDIGCGLGFLSCVCAKYYPSAMITGFDTFEDASLKKSSLAKARNNAKLLGLSRRIKFQKKNIFKADYCEEDFDIFVSNLVFHNLGKKRFEAYKKLANWAGPRSYTVLGEWFLDYDKDFQKLSSLFGIVREMPRSIGDKSYKLLVLSKPTEKTN